MLVEPFLNKNKWRLNALSVFFLMQIIFFNLLIKKIYLHETL